MPFQLMVQNKNAMGERQNSYQNQKLLQETNILDILRNKVFLVFFKNRIFLNLFFALKCIYVLMHLRGVVLVYGGSMVTENV